MNLPSFTSVPDAVALDLDGTLLNSAGMVSSRTIQTLEHVIERGIPVVFATSRPARQVHRVIPAELLEHCSCVSINGAVSKGSYPLSGYYKNTIPETIIRGVLDIIMQSYPETIIYIEIEGHEFGSNWKADRDLFWENNAATPEMLLSIEESIARRPSKIAIEGVGDDTLTLSKLLRTSYGEHLTIVPAMMWSPMLNITGTDVSKTNALRSLLEKAGRSLENTVAFGDDYPDLDMLTHCGYGIAMKNAFDDIKTACGYTTVSNDEDGVAVVLEKILEL